MLSHNVRWSVLRGFAILLSVSLLAAVAAAAPPQIKSLSLRGLTTDATTTLSISGANLLPEPRLLLSVPIAKQAVRAGATANQVQLDVTLAAGTPPGIYQLRVATSQGVSEPAAIGIDHLEELPFAPEIAKLPVALNGLAPGSTVLRTSFEGHARQQIVIDVESRRLDGKLNPVLHLYDGRNVQLAWAQANDAIFGDARLVTELPTDGRYTVELHDALFQGGASAHFRMKIGLLHYADMVFPPAVQLKTVVPLGFVSTNFPPGTAVVAEGRLTGQSPAPWPPIATLTGARPRLIVSELPEVLENSDGGSLQQLTAPMAVSGRLAIDGEEDRYEVIVQPGTRLKFDCMASRLGSPLDGVLSVSTKAGVLATSDDRPETSDPGLDLIVPKNVNSVIVSLKDLSGRGGPEFIYRIAASQSGAADFALNVLASEIELPTAGVVVVRVRADRVGYNGPIKLSFAGAPEGVKIASGELIPPGASDTLLTIAAGATNPTALLTSLVSESVDAKVQLRRAARIAETPLSKHQPWLREELALAVTERSPLAVAWESSGAQPSLPLGSALMAGVKLTRDKAATGKVRLALVTSQIIPQKKVVEKLPKGQRPTVEKFEDDLERALRLESELTLGPGQDLGIARILVPGDLPNIPYDVALKAELLAADNKTVLATAWTPALRMNTTFPFTIELTGPAKVEAKAGTGATGELRGKITRTAGFKQPVTVTLGGLPPELPAPTVDVPAAQAEFSLPVSFPFQTAKGDLAGVKLLATGVLAPGKIVRSNEVPTAVTVVAGGPPPALVRIFEDEPAFVAALTEGDGKATLDESDRYVGTAALKVTPSQRSRPRLPGLGIKIAEKPGDGEYRYLRFAWKIDAGNNIFMQLVSRDAPKDRLQGPSFAYEAGDGANQLRYPAIRLSEKLPKEWTVVTRDLFADFGAFTWDGLLLMPGNGSKFALFDHIYLAKSEKDLEGCPSPVTPEQPLALFEDQPAYNLGAGFGAATLTADDKYSGKSSLQVRPEHMLAPLAAKVRKNPGPGEYRFLQFAWKKNGGDGIILQLASDKPAAVSRYLSGKLENRDSKPVVGVSGELPTQWTVVTRDLYADFGEFTLTGLNLVAQDGDSALIDHVYLGRNLVDFSLLESKKK